MDLITPGVSRRHAGRGRPDDEARPGAYLLAWVTVNLEGAPRPGLEASRAPGRPRPRRLSAMNDVTRILSALEQGDPRAAAALLPLVYDELRKLAARRLAQ